MRTGPQPLHGSTGGGCGGAMSADVGSAISVASNPSPIEIALHVTPEGFVTLLPLRTMSDVCWICDAMLMNALSEHNDVEICPAIWWSAAISSCVSSAPAIVPFVTEPGACG